MLLSAFLKSRWCFLFLLSLTLIVTACDSTPSQSPESPIPSPQPIPISSPRLKSSQLLHSDLNLSSPDGGVLLDSGATPLLSSRVEHSESGSLISGMAPLSSTSGLETGVMRDAAGAEEGEVNSLLASGLADIQVEALEVFHDALEQPQIVLNASHGSVLGGQAVEFTGPHMHLVQSVHLQGHPEKKFCEHLYTTDQDHLYCFVRPSANEGDVNLTLNRIAPHAPLNLDHAYTFTAAAFEVHGISQWERTLGGGARFKIYGTGFSEGHLRVQVQGYECGAGLSVLEQGTLAICQIPAIEMPVPEERMPYLARVRVIQPGLDGHELMRELILQRIDFESLTERQIELRALAQGYRVRGFEEGEDIPRGVPGGRLIPRFEESFLELRESIFREILLYSRAWRVGVVPRWDQDFTHGSLVSYYRAFLMEELHLDPDSDSSALLWTRLHPDAQFLSPPEMRRNFLHGRNEMLDVVIYNEAGERVTSPYERLQRITHEGYTVDALMDRARAVLTAHPELRRIVRQMGREVEETPQLGVLRSTYNYLWSFVSSPPTEPMPSDSAIREVLRMLGFIQAIHG